MANRDQNLLDEMIQAAMTADVGAQLGPDDEKNFRNGIGSEAAAGEISRKLKALKPRTFQVSRS